ncbi:MAG: hypothetical protein Q8S29_12630 [Phreatobacter sp.]|nr:hypothetical protein [Phreatobacter sp.]
MSRIPFRLPVILGLIAALQGMAAAEAQQRQASCRANGARYVLIGTPQVTALFRGAVDEATAASDLVFQVTTPQRDYLFRFHQSQGYGRISLEPVAHPGRTPGYRYRPLPQPEGTPLLVFNAFTRALRRVEEPPRIGRPAPDLIFVPDLGSRLWYDPASLTDLAGAERDPVPTAMFRRVFCGPGRDPGR